MNEQSVTECIKKAFDCKASGNYKQAIELFYKALTLDGDSSAIMSEIAALYLKINNVERAIEYYEQALLFDPFNLEIKFNLALIYKHIGNLEKALPLLEFIYTKSKKTDYFVELIHSLYLLNRYEEVLDIYSKSELQDSNSALLYFYIGLANNALSRFDEAEKKFRKSLSKDPSNSEVKYNLAELLFNKKRFDDAERLLLEILDQKICAKSYFLVGEINFLQNRFEKAINYLSIASNIEFKNSLYYYELGMAYSMKGFMKEAEDNFLKAIKISPNNLLYNYTLAYLYYQTDSISKVKQKLSYILSINPHHVDALVLKALIASNEDDVVIANKIIDEVLSITTSNDFAYYVQAILYKKLNWWEKAIESIEKAIRLKPDSLEYLSELSQYYYEAKLYGDAKSLCKKMLEINDKFIFAYIMLGKIYVQNKDFKSALKYLDIAVSYDNNSHEVHYLKAEVLKATELKSMAIDCAKAAVSMAPEIVKYYVFIAQCYFEQRKYKDSYFYYKEASSLEPMNALHKYQMAKCSQNLQEISNTISNYSVARRLEPANILIVKDYSDFLISIKKYKQAEEVLKSALEFNPACSETIELSKRIKEVKVLIDQDPQGIRKLFAKFKK